MYLFFLTGLMATASAPEIPMLNCLTLTFVPISLVFTKGIHLQTLVCTQTPTAFVPAETLRYTYQYMYNLPKLKTPTKIIFSFLSNSE